MVKPGNPLAQSGQNQLASDPPPQPSTEDQWPNNQVTDEDDVIDPDPISWALPASGDHVAPQPAGSPFTEVQLVHMYHLGHKVNWNLKDYQCDRTVVTRICSDIGITRDQFRSWVHNKKNRKRRIKGVAGPSGTGSGGSGRSRTDAGGPPASLTD